MKRTIDGIVTSLRFNGISDAAACGTRDGLKTHLTYDGRKTKCGARITGTYETEGQRWSPQLICRRCFSDEVAA